MKTIFRNIGILALACFSFLVTDETIMVVKESDKLMIEIKEKMAEYYVQEIDGKIDDKYIKIGSNGLEIDALKSYEKMKKIGYFNENMLVYKKIKPLNSIVDNKDKIINANSKNEVVLLFDEPNDIDKIINILKNNDLKGSFLISRNYYLNNFESLEIALQNKNNIVIKDEINFFKKELKNNYYCYSKSINKCNTYIIEETSYIEKYKDLKKELNRGTILIIKDSSYLDIYIKYILSKGINIVSLDKFISEE